MLKDEDIDAGSKCQIGRRLVQLWISIATIETTTTFGVPCSSAAGAPPLPKTNRQQQLNLASYGPNTPLAFRLLALVHHCLSTKIAVTLSSRLDP